MTVSPSSEDFTVLVQRLAATTVVKNVTISDDTEVYFDLRISGQDLYELISWIAREFEVDFSGMNIDDYAPSDGVDLLELLSFGLWKRRYKSLTVGALRRAIDTKTWTQSTHDRGRGDPDL